MSKAYTDNMKPCISVFRPIFQNVPDDIRESAGAIEETLK